MRNFGRVDVVINNAGHLRNAPFESVTDDILDSIIQVHLKGAFYVTQPAYGIMQKQRYGRIVFAASAAGMLGNPTQSAYGAAKAGLVGLMHCSRSRAPSTASMQCVAANGKQPHGERHAA